MYRSRGCNMVPNEFRGTIEVVVAAFDDGDTIAVIQDIITARQDLCELPREHIWLTVYEKSQEDVPYDCERLPNIGREQHTWMHHFSTRYGALADLTICVPGNLAKYPHRRDLLVRLLLKQNSFDPSSDLSDAELHVSHNMHLTDDFVGSTPYDGDKLDGAAGFTLHRYGDNINGVQPRALDRAEPQGLRAWCEHHLNENWEDVKHLRVCYNGHFAVKKEAVQRRPQAVYARLLVPLSVNEPEASHCENLPRALQRAHPLAPLWICPTSSHRTRERIVQTLSASRKSSSPSRAAPSAPSSATGTARI